LAGGVIEEIELGSMCTFFVGVVWLDLIMRKNILSTV
jgi:hypothetical protein